MTLRFGVPMFLIVLVIERDTFPKVPCPVHPLWRYGCKVLRLFLPSLGLLDDEFNFKTHTSYYDSLSESSPPDFKVKELKWKIIIIWKDYFRGNVTLFYISRITFFSSQRQNVPNRILAIINDYSPRRRVLKLAFDFSNSVLYRKCLLPNRKKELRAGKRVFERRWVLVTWVQSQSMAFMSQATMSGCFVNTNCFRGRPSSR